MAALQCEICGGKLIGKPGGLFECEFCGVEYDTFWAKAKIQEIKGTVKVEGTVEVTGTVKVEGGVTLENLLKRGQDALADRNWARADDFYEKALDIDSENGQAYLGKLLAELRLSKQEDLAKQRQPFANNSNCKKALSFADATLRSKLKEYIAASNICIEEERSAYKKRQQEKQDAQEKDRLEKVYTRAQSIISGAKNVSEYQDAIALFETIPYYKDAAALAEQYSKQWNLWYEEQMKEQTRREARIRQAQIWESAEKCRYCGGELKGFFSKKCVSCGKPKDY